MLITKENFSEIWKNTDKKLRYAKKCRVIGGLIGTIGMIIFAMCSIAAVFIAIYHRGPEFYAEFMEMIPGLIPLVLKFESEYIAAGGGTENELIYMCTALAYIPAIIFAVAVTILVHMIYHPFKTKQEEGNEKKNAKLLVSNLTQIRKLSVKAEKNLVGVACVFDLVVVAALVLLYVFFSNSETVGIQAMGNRSTIEMILSLFGMTATLFLAFYLLNLSYIWITKIFYWCKIPYAKLADAESFKCFIEEETAGKSVEEVQAARKEIYEKNLSNAIDAEKNGNYARAEELLMYGACAGIVDAMDRLAFVLSKTDKEAAIYWYQRCMDSGEALDGTKARIRTLKRGKRIEPYR